MQDESRSGLSLVERPATTRVLLLALALMAMGTIATLSVENLQLSAALVNSAPARETRSEIRVGDPLPGMGLREVLPGGTGSTATLSEISPATAIVFFYTSTCPFCARSKAFLATLGENLNGTSATCVEVALDGQAVPYEQLEIGGGGSWKILTPPERSLAIQLPISHVPTTVVADATGTVMNVWNGELNAETAAEIEAIARQVLGASR